MPGFNFISIDHIPEPVLEKIRDQLIKELSISIQEDIVILGMLYHADRVYFRVESSKDELKWVERGWENLNTDNPTEFKNHGGSDD